MNQELFNPQSSSVSSSRITPHQPLPEHPCSICRRPAPCRPSIRIHPRGRIWCRSFALSFCLAKENFPMRSRHTSWGRAIACSSTAGKRAAILHAKKYIEELSKKFMVL